MSRATTGFTQASALALREKLDAIEMKECPFAPRPAGLRRGVHWVRPVLVAEVEFGEWTGDGKVRHASFQGLRADKSAREVVRETPASASTCSTGARGGRPRSRE